MNFVMPPVLNNTAGQPRTVGFELEFGGVELEVASTLIQKLYGGNIIRKNHFLHCVENTCLGTFNLKMDSRVLTEKKYEQLLDKLGIDPNNEKAIEMVESVASFIVPYEIGTPAVPMNQVHEFEKLRKGLFDNEAKGTRRSLLTAYATHINPEAPSMDAATLLHYIKAFLLLYPWMFDRAKIYITRRLSNYINPFPEEYVKLVLQCSYRPDMYTLVEDYHRYNPDRNRPLDMYPVFSLASPEQVKSFEDIGNVKPRPTFHYRLPNCLIDEEDWCLAEEWDTWIKVEFLANNPETLEQLSREYLEMEDNTLFNFSGRWVDRIEEWLNAAF